MDVMDDKIVGIHFGFDHASRDLVRTCTVRADFGTSPEHAKAIVDQLKTLWPNHVYRVVTEQPTEVIELLKEPRRGIRESELQKP